MYGASRLTPPGFADPGELPQSGDASRDGPGQMTGAYAGRRLPEPQRKGMHRAFMGLVGRTISRGLQTRSGMYRLEQLDDRMLADIGITRAQIYDAAIRGRQR